MPAEAESSIELPLQTRAGAVLVPGSVDAEARTVELVWSTGAVVRRRDPCSGKRYDEVLSLEPGHVDLARLNGGAPLLNTHGAFALEDVLGVVERAWLARTATGHEGRALVRFSERDAVEPVWRDVVDGIIRNVSVGYQVRAYEITERQGEVPLWRAADWEPVELSAVPVGADGGAGFRSNIPIHPCRLVEPAASPLPVQETRTMDHEPLAAAEPAAPTPARELPALSEPLPARILPVAEPAPANDNPAPTPPEPDAAALRGIAERVLAEERGRIAGIVDAARKLGLDSTIGDDLVHRGVTLDEARRHLIDQAAARDRTADTRPHVRAGALDAGETRRAAVETALLHRFDPHRYPLSEPARDWRGLSLVELAREVLGAEGIRVRGLAREEVAVRALHSTSDFPAILAAVTNKTLRDAYEAAPRTFQAIARRATASNFKLIHRVQLGEAPRLEKVNEAGEFRRGAIGEGQESYRVETYGKVVAITRQAIVNDDLDAFTRVPSLFGTSAANLESDVVWGIVQANPVMANGNALFHANHKNVAGTGTALDVANLGKARTAMAKQTGLDGKTLLNIRPAFLLVPSALELTAEQLVAQNLVPAQTANVVPASIRSLSVIAEPRLDPASGAVPWYLFASPAAIDTLEYAYLEGQEGVYIETRMGFDVDGLEIKCRLDFGAAAIDFRGLYKNAGIALS